MAWRSMAWRNQNKYIVHSAIGDAGAETMRCYDMV